MKKNQKKTRQNAKPKDLYNFSSLTASDESMEAESLSYVQISAHNAKLKTKLNKHIRSLQSVQKTELGFPSSYNQTRLVLMVRDPYWVYVYWDLDDQKSQEIEYATKDKSQQYQTILRFYDIPHEEKDPIYTDNKYSFDIVVPISLGEWYVYLGKPTHRFYADLGLLSKDNDFYLVAWSNHVTLPSDSPSLLVDNEWQVKNELFDSLYVDPQNAPSSFCQKKERK